MAQDLYNHPDYYLLDELLTDEHKMILRKVDLYDTNIITLNVRTN
jgi:glutaryl-CoA dehydrogenase